MRCRTLGVAVLLLMPFVGACEGGISIDVDVDGDDDIAGSGTVVTENREVADFDKITLAGEGTVIVAAGGGPSLSVEADDNLMAYIETSVANGTLEITTRPGIDIDPSETIRYVVMAPDVTELKLTGAGRFEMNDLSGDDFSTVLTGAGDIEIVNLSVARLDVEITGVGSVRLGGTAQTQDVLLSGAGSYEASDLESAAATILSSGVGSATVWATDTLTATVTGVGSIDYYGSPQVTQTVTGVGSINSRGAR